MRSTSHSSCSRTSTKTGASARAAGLGGLDLVDLGAEALEEVAVGGHYFQKGSGFPTMTTARFFPVSPRARIYTLVGLSAAGAAAVVVGITAATHHSPPAPRGPRSGSPPFAADWTAPAGLTAEVRRAMSAWPEGTVAAMRGLARRHPGSSLVRLNLGLALYWRATTPAPAAWRRASACNRTRRRPFARRPAPPELAARAASVPAHFARPTTAVQRLLGARDAAAAERPAASRRRRSSRPRQRWRRAIPDAQVAAAVGLYDKDGPAAAFGRLGPLSAAFRGRRPFAFISGYSPSGSARSPRHAESSSSRSGWTRKRSRQGSSDAR